MTRENKLALVVGFGLILFVGILVSDHFSAQRLDAATLTQASIGNQSPQAELTPITSLEVRGGGETLVLVPPSTLELDTAAQVTLDTTAPDAAQATEQGLPISVAMNDDPEETVRFYTVQPGDTLWKIAVREYGDGTVSKELAEYNKAALTNGLNLSVNQKLRLPTFRRLRPTRMAERVAVAPPVGQRESTQKLVTPQAPRTHTVAKGDTIYQLSRKFNVKPQAIMAANGIADAGALKPGQTLRIPVASY